MDTSNDTGGQPMGPGHILFVSNLYPRPDEPQRGQFNGAMVRALGDAAARRGLRVAVLVPVAERDVRRFASIRGWTVPGEAACEASVQYVPYLHVPYLGRPFAGYACWQALRAHRALFKGAVGVIGSWLYPDAVAAHALAQALGRPHVARLHGSDRYHLDAWWRGRLSRRCLSGSVAVAVNASTMWDELVARGVDAGRISVIPNGVDEQRFRPPDAGTREKGTVLWVGHLIEVKDPARALRVFRMLVEGENPGGRDYRLQIVGAGPLRVRLQNQVHAWNGQEQIQFLGELGSDALAEAMRRASCLLLTSRSEGMPNVVLEALSSGTPVVCVPAGDTPKVVRDAVNGYCVAASGADGDRRLAAALHQAMAREWDDESVRSTVSAYRWSQSAERLLDLLGAGKAG